MPRINVPFVVDKQHITQPTGEKLVSGGQNYFYATFEINEVWENISNIKAVFVRDDISKLVDLINTETGYECQIPWEVMSSKGAFQVGIFGGDRLLTDYTYVIVKQGCVVEGEVPAPPTPDWFDKIDRHLLEIEEGKANKEDIYSKNEIEGLVTEKIDDALDDYSTKEEVRSQIEEETKIIKSDIEGIQEDIQNEAHFRGYLSTNAKIQALEATPNDFAYSAESGTTWVYDADGLIWYDTGVPVPDQLTPASDSTPLINGVASVGTEESYARGDHRHPTDTTRASVEDLNNLKSTIETALDNIIAIQNLLIGGDGV